MLTYMESVFFRTEALVFLEGSYPVKHKASAAKHCLTGWATNENCFASSMKQCFFVATRSKTHKNIQQLSFFSDAPISEFSYVLPSFPTKGS